MHSLTRAIILTVSYADIFSYPLTSHEVWRWLIQKQSSAQAIERALGISHAQYVSLKGKSALVSTRYRREQVSEQKMCRARRTAALLRYIPFVLLVGVTGTLAMENSQESDDIDLFIITRAHTLWVSRAIVTILLEIIGVRRHPDSQQVQNLFCLNMFMGEDSLGIVYDEQDLYIAHEVLQMKPLWERDGAYGRFLSANSWVRKYLPNAWEEKNSELRDLNHEVGSMKYEEGNRKVEEIQSMKRFMLHASCVMLRLFEPFARTLQLWYMRNRRTREVTTDSIIRFHPRDTRAWVKREFTVRLRRLHLPLDNIFRIGV